MDLNSSFPTLTTSRRNYPYISDSQRSNMFNSPSNNDLLEEKIDSNHLSSNPSVVPSSSSSHGLLHMFNTKKDTLMSYKNFVSRKLWLIPLFIVLIIILGIFIYNYHQYQLEIVQLKEALEEQKEEDNHSEVYSTSSSEDESESEEDSSEEDSDDD